MWLAIYILVNYYNNATSFFFYETIRIIDVAAYRFRTRIANHSEVHLSAT